MVGIPKRKMEVCTYFADFSPVSNWHICIWRCKEIGHYHAAIPFAEGVSLWLLDRYTVKHHIAFLQNRQSHLKETEVFLKKTIPDVNLFQEELIDELIKRFSDRIDQRVPFKNFLKGIESFAKAIILPIITYVAGVYSAGLEEISIDVVATYAVFIIMLLGIVRLSWVGFSDIAKTFFCRDYNAAIAFREDLLDLRLLYFRIDKDANKND